MADVNDSVKGLTWLSTMTCGSWRKTVGAEDLIALLVGLSPKEEAPVSYCSLKKAESGAKKTK